MMACDDYALPPQKRVEAVMHETDLMAVYETERHLLYVACTRARDSIWVSGVTPESGFLRAAPYQSVRSRGTDFGQLGFEPGQVPTALKPAFYLGFWVPY